MSLVNIDGSDLIRGVKSGCIKLEHNRDKVDLLNVFPVPDGDTGTNMYLTLLSAVKEGENNYGKPLAAVAKAISNGSLMGARGNSGVILSQVFRGFARLLENKEQASAIDLALALKAGADTAYDAVMKPVEGTILTVIREIARACEAESQKNPDIAGVLLAGIKVGHITLQKTPSMLPILREAGVVDAGGQGLLYFMEGMLEGLDREREIGADEYRAAIHAGEKEKSSAVYDFAFQYCTETLIKGNNLDTSDIKDHLAPLGDSMLVVGGDELVKVHIHTNHPGKVLESCLQFGNLSDIKINNMMEEVHEHRNNWKEAEEQAVTMVQPKIGLVAVAAGSGVNKILKSLGVDVVVEGGQTMNPSTEDLIKACQEVDAESIIILPNNSNVILTARQVIQLYDKRVEVVATKSVMQAITALIAYNPEGDIDLVAKAMEEEIEQVKYAEVTYAVRDSSINGLDIKEMDTIGIIGDEIVLTASNSTEAVINLLGKMIDEESQLITFFYGDNVGEEEAYAVKDMISEKNSDCEVDVHYGGQPHYSYLISVE